MTSKGKHWKLSKETKDKMSKAKKGKIFTDEHRKKLSLSLKGKKKNYPNGKFFSQEHRKKLSLARKGKPMLESAKKKLRNRIVSEKTKQKHRDRKHTEEEKRKMRIGMFNHLKKRCGILFPNIGKNETKILDNVEQELNTKILRQYKCEGYFLDGYIPEINVAIEVDERPKIKEKDIEREKIIKNKLKCKLIRIKDYD